MKFLFPFPIVMMVFVTFALSASEKTIGQAIPGTLCWFTDKYQLLTTMLSIVSVGPGVPLEQGMKLSNTWIQYLFILYMSRTTSIRAWISIISSWISIISAWITISWTPRIPRFPSLNQKFKSKYQDLTIEQFSIF